MIEDDLKYLILRKYKSIREFANVINMPYSTIDSIFKRGLQNSGLANIIVICRELGISVDSLAEGAIVYAGGNSPRMNPLSAPALEVAEAYDAAPEPVQDAAYRVLEPYMPKQKKTAQAGGMRGPVTAEELFADEAAQDAQSVVGEEA